MSKHSSVPWSIKDFSVVDADGRIVCEPVSGLDAELMVRWSHCFNDLLVACETMLPNVIGHSKMWCEGDCDVCKIRDSAEAIIARAKGESK